MYKVGDMAVYPAQGVGIVESIEAKDFGGETHDFYILRIVDTDTTIMVPTKNANNVGLRRLVGDDEIRDVFSLLGKPLEIRPALTSWSRRQREYQDKIKTGDIFGVAEVLRELCLIRGAKELSYGEKKVLEHARRLLVKEIALSQGSAEALVAARVDGTYI